MGKLRSDKKKKPAPASSPRPVLRGTPEQLARNQPAIKFLRELQAKAARMTPAQRARADREWEIAKAAINQERVREGRPPICSE